MFKSVNLLHMYYLLLIDYKVSAMKESPECLARNFNSQ